MYATTTDGKYSNRGVDSESGSIISATQSVYGDFASEKSARPWNMVARPVKGNSEHELSSLERRYPSLNPADSESWTWKQLRGSRLYYESN